MKTLLGLPERSMEGGICAVWLLLHALVLLYASQLHACCMYAVCWVLVSAGPGPSLRTQWVRAMWRACHPPVWPYELSCGWLVMCCDWSVMCAAGVCGGGGGRGGRRGAGVASLPQCWRPVQWSRASGSPASRLSSVLFPAPEGPMRAIRRPASAPPLIPFMSWMGPAWLLLPVAGRSLRLAPPAADGALGAELLEEKLLPTSCCWLLLLLAALRHPSQDFLGWRVYPRFTQSKRRPSCW
jgi:hypothetical protein